MQENANSVKKVTIMKQESYWNTSDPLKYFNGKCPPEHFVWSTSEQARLRGLSLFLIRSIVERHGGTIHIDLATDTINIDVPDEEQLACAQEIE